MSGSKGVGMDWLPLVCRFALGALFLWTGASKFTNRAAFRQAVQGYTMVPAWSSRWVSATVPAGELLVGLSLLVGLFTGVAATAAGCMLVAFATAMAVNLAQGKRTACGCGTGPGQRISWIAVSRNAVLTGVAAVVVVAPASPLSVEPNPSGELSANEAWIITLSVGITALLALIVGRAFTLLRLTRRLTAIDGAAT